MKKILLSVLLSLPFFSPSSVFAKHSYNPQKSSGSESLDTKRIALAKKGIKLNASLITDSAYLVSGGRHSGARPETSAHLGLDANFDMQKLAGWDGVSIHAQMTARQGQTTGGVIYKIQLLQNYPVYKSHSREVIKAVDCLNCL